jgi:hypothetical protein
MAALAAIRDRATTLSFFNMMGTPWGWVDGTGCGALCLAITVSMAVTVKTHHQVKN